MKKIHVKKIYVKKGQEIIKEGDESSSAFVIETGTVEISKTNKKGKKRVLAVLREKDFFGELGVIDGLPRSASANALEDCIIEEITKETFDDLSKTNPKALMPFLRVIASRLRATLKTMEDYKPSRT